MKILNLTLTAVLFLAIAGCSAISRETLKDVDKSITIEMVQARPEELKGRRVVWGGTILSTQNLENATEIEVFETDLSFDYSPREGASRGRFLIRTPRFLDSNVYSNGKKITVAGTVEGVETRKIGKMDYPYPVVVPKEMKLFEPLPPQDYSTYPPYWFGPAYPFSPYPYPNPHPFYPGPYPYRYPYWPYPY